MSRAHFNRKGALAAFVCLSFLVFAPGARAGDPSEYGIESVAASLSTTQAGAHPDFTTEIELKTDPAGPMVSGFNPPYARTRNLSVMIPPGLIGNPENFPQCSSEQFGVSPKTSNCPQDSQIGVTEVAVYGLSDFIEPVYLMEPPAGGDIVARIGFMAGLYPTVLDVRLRPEDGYSLEARLENANAIARLVRAKTTLWGVPSAESHDPQRVTAMEALSGDPPPGGGRSSGLSPVPFIANPTRCGVAQEVDFATDSYQFPDRISTATAGLPRITGCGRLVFDPRISVRPTALDADSPSGLDTEISVPQEGLRDPGALATPHLKRAVVQLPEGLTLNPASANGLSACSEEQIGLISENPIRFDAAPPTCPESSKVGTAQVSTPVLAAPLEGSLFLASQGANPFHALLAGYLVVEGQGVMLKLAGRFEVDPASGRITAVFDDSPQQPFETLRLHFKGGAQGVLTTPSACGAYSIASNLVPWSETEAVSESSAFDIAHGPGGGPCPSGVFAPAFSAGTVNPTAGAYSPLVLRLGRDDGTGRLRGLTLTLPRGLTGKLAGIPYCPEAALSRAASLGEAGQAVAELGVPSCPPGSQLGFVTVGAGSGPSPLFVDTGKVFLAGPYNGAPISLAVITPALAGPFDLGNVVVRVALHVEPQTAELTAISDPLPTVLHGIPLDLRDLRVSINRSRFTLNPTSCLPKRFSGTVTAEGGATAPISQRFQAASCASLGFKPRLSLRLAGATRRTGHPSLRAVLRARKGDANIGRTVVIMPRSQFIDNARIGNPCTRPQFAARACPPKSLLGRARAFTPLLDAPLEGPVYFRSNGGARELPDIVADLRGQIDITLVGFVDSVRRRGSEVSRIRTTFARVPDAPVSKVALRFLGGRRGLLVNSTNLCAVPQRASVELEGQNGRNHNLNALIQTPCGGRGG